MLVKKLSLHGRDTLVAFMRIGDQCRLTEDYFTTVGAESDLVKDAMGKISQMSGEENRASCYFEPRDAIALKNAYTYCASTYGDKFVGLGLHAEGAARSDVSGVKMCKVSAAALLLPLFEFTEECEEWAVNNYLCVITGKLYKTIVRGSVCEVESISTRVNLQELRKPGGLRSWLGYSGDDVINFLNTRMDNTKMYNKDEAVRHILSKLVPFGGTREDYDECVKDLRLWRPTSKKYYAVYICRPSIGTKVENCLEGSYYITSEQKPYVVSGTQGEVWAIDADKLGKTYMFESGEPITEETLQAKFGNAPFDWVKVVTITDISKKALYWAMFLGDSVGSVNFPVATPWGEILYANRPGVPHGEGDFLVCSDKCGSPNLNDMWVVNGCIFPATYDMTSFPECCSETVDVRDLAMPKPL